MGVVCALVWGLVRNGICHVQRGSVGAIVWLGRLDWGWIYSLLLHRVVLWNVFNDRFQRTPVFIHRTGYESVVVAGPSVGIVEFRHAGKSGYV